MNENTFENTIPWYRMDTISYQADSVDVGSKIGRTFLGLA